MISKEPDEEAEQEPVFVACTGTRLQGQGCLWVMSEGPAKGVTLAGHLRQGHSQRGLSSPHFLSQMGTSFKPQGVFEVVLM